METEAPMKNLDNAPYSMSLDQLRETQVSHPTAEYWKTVFSVTVEKLFKVCKIK
jgi:hypothetical protein